MLKKVLRRYYRIFLRLLHPNGMVRTINNVRCRFVTDYARGVPANIPFPMLRTLLDRAKSAHTVLELGGHIGIWTELIANSMPADGKLYVFEPNPTTFQVLKRQAAVSLSTRKITTVQKAVGNAPGTLKFEMCADNAGSFDNSAKSKLQVSAHGVAGDVKLVDVEVTTVDKFCSEQHIVPDLVKMDIEGAELLALKGMDHILKTGKTVVVIEMHQFAWSEFGYTAKDMLEFMQRYPNYAFRDSNGNIINTPAGDWLDNLKVGYTLLEPVN